MPIAPLIARGIGFSPGSTRYIPTLGLSLPTPTPPAPGDETLDDVLAGAYGPARLRFRYPLHDVGNGYVADATEAVISCSISMESNRPIARTATFAIDEGRLPRGFDRTTQFVAPMCDVLVNGIWQTFQLGLFRLAQPRRRIMGASTLWSANASDMAELAQIDRLDNVFKLRVGDDPGDRASDVLADVPGLRYSIPSFGLTVERGFKRIWPVGTPRLNVANDILASYGWTLARANEVGALVPRRVGSYYGINRWDDLPVRTLRSRSYPQNVQWPIEDMTDVRDYPNKVFYQSHPIVRKVGTTQYSGTVTNNDSRSPVSTIYWPERVEAFKALAGLDSDQRVAIHRIMMASIASECYGVSVLFDPRAGVGETYTLELPDGDRLAYCHSWSVDLGVQPQRPVRTEMVLGLITDEMAMDLTVASSIVVDDS